MMKLINPNEDLIVFTIGKALSSGEDTESFMK